MDLEPELMHIQEYLISEPRHAEASYAGIDIDILGAVTSTPQGDTQMEMAMCVLA